MYRRRGPEPPTTLHYQAHRSCRLTRLTGAPLRLSAGDDLLLWLAAAHPDPGLQPGALHHEPAVPAEARLRPGQGSAAAASAWVHLRLRVRLLWVRRHAVRGGSHGEAGVRLRRWAALLLDAPAGGAAVLAIEQEAWEEEGEVHVEASEAHNGLTERRLGEALREGFRQVSWGVRAPGNTTRRRAQVGPLKECMERESAPAPQPFGTPRIGI